MESTKTLYPQYKCYKLVLLGQSMTGKSQIIQRYTKDSFNDKHIPTTAITDFFIVSKYVELDHGDTN